MIEFHHDGKMIYRPEQKCFQAVPKCFVHFRKVYEVKDVVLVGSTLVCDCELLGELEAGW